MKGKYGCYHSHAYAFFNLFVHKEVHCGIDIYHLSD